MTTQEQTGFAAICLVDGGGEYRLPLSDYERIKAEWMAGKAFIEFVDYFGAVGVVKCSRVDSVFRYLPDDIAARNAHADEVRAERALRGED